jgi:hypothetical protein
MSFIPPLTRMKRLRRRLARGPKLPLALSGAILLSIALTIVSVSWYALDGTSKLDFSRPGYERERAEVLTTGTQKTYDTTSPVTRSTTTGPKNSADSVHSPIVRSTTII